MKYRIEYRTPYHSFFSRTLEGTMEEIEKKKDEFRNNASAIGWVAMLTKTGWLILPKDLASQTAILIHIKGKDSKDGLDNDQTGS